MVTGAGECIWSRPLFQTGYKNINPGLITAMSYRCNVKTNSFHLPVKEMIVTLDDVTCLLHIPIVGRLVGDEDVGYETGMPLLQSEMGMMEEEAIGEVNKQCGGYIIITHLKGVYDRLIHRCNELE